MKCFYINMESVNAHMKNSSFNVGVIVPPDSFKKKVVYSDSQASQDVCRINSDIYTGKKNAKNLNEKKTPKSVFVVLGLGTLSAAYLCLKRLFKR